MHSATIDSRNFRFAEFFAGIGLMRLGLERADKPWTCVFANDIDPMKRTMYASHFRSEPEEIDSTDVHELPGDSVPDIELATASFPCTDLSIAGGRAGLSNGQSSAFWGFHRVLDEMGARRPGIVLLENVTGFLTSHGGRDFLDALMAINSLGYRVDPFILDARWFVPQSRPRLFVVCSRRGSGEGKGFDLLRDSRLRPGPLVEFIASHSRDIAWCIRDLREPPAETTRRLKDIVANPPNGHEDWWSPERVDYLYNQMFPRHQQWLEERRDSSRYKYATAFRRVRPQPDGTKRSMAELRTDGIAGCLRTPKGGSGRQILVRVGRGRLDARLISGAECASLMGASGYTIEVSSNQALFGFGDAVCVDVVAWIARNYLQPLLSEARSQDSGYAPPRDGRAAVPAPATP